MKKTKLVHVGLSCSLALILGACGGGGGSDKPKSSSSTSSVSSTTSSLSSAPTSSASSLSSASEVSSVGNSISSETSSSTVNSSVASSVVSNSSASSTSTAPVSVGKFVDSAVGGINYKTETQSGITNAAGEYNYREGETVTFFIGDLEFPPVLARGVLTPLNIAGVDDPTNSVVVNIARLLQSLDVDGDPSNGISIPEEAADNAAEVDFTLSIADFAASTAVTTLIANSGSVTTTIISEDAALSHLDDSVNQVKQSLIGSWYYRDANGSVNEQSHIVITFLDEENYVIATDEPVINDNGKDGFERGTYTWNPRTGLFQVEVSVDDNGEWGFSHPCEGEEFKFDLVENKLYLTTESEMGETCDAAEDGEANLLVLERVPSTSLFGTWKANTEGGDLAIVTFMEGNHYMMVQDTAEDDNGKPGIERGTFTYNQSTKEILFTTLNDHNLQWGFSHPCAVVESFSVNENAVNELNCGPEGRDILQTAELNTDGDVLTFISEADTIAGGGTENPGFFFRVPRIDPAIVHTEGYYENMEGKILTSVIISSLCPDVPGNFEYEFSESSVKITGTDGWDSECVLGDTDVVTVSLTEINNLNNDFPFVCEDYPACTRKDFNKQVSGIDVDDRRFNASSYYDFVNRQVIYKKEIIETNVLLTFNEEALSNAGHTLQSMSELFGSAEIVGDMQILLEGNGLEAGDLVIAVQGEGNVPILLKEVATLQELPYVDHFYEEVISF